MLHETLHAAVYTLKLQYGEFFLLMEKLQTNADDFLLNLEAEVDEFIKEQTSAEEADFYEWLIGTSFLFDYSPEKVGEEYLARMVEVIIHKSKLPEKPIIYGLFETLALYIEDFIFDHCFYEILYAMDQNNLVRIKYWFAKLNDLQKNILLQHTDSTGLTILQRAIEKNSEEILRICMLDNEGNLRDGMLEVLNHPITIHYNDGKSIHKINGCHLLHCAAMHNASDAFGTILEYTDNPEVLTQETKESPYDLAQKFRAKDIIEILKPDTESDSEYQPMQLR